MMALRAAAAWLFTGAYWIGAWVIQGLTLRGLGFSSTNRIIRRWSKVAAWLVGLRIEYLRPNPMQDRRPRIIVFNHQSALDMIWVADIMPPAALALGKKELIFVPFVNLAWWVMDFRRVDRADPAKARAALTGVAREISEEKRSLIIAPEGTRTRDGEFLPFKRGAFVLAVQSQAPIYPVVVSGAYELLPRQSFLPKPGVIRLSFLEPVPTAGVPVSEIGALMERVRGEMLKAYQAQRLAA